MPLFLGPACFIQRITAQKKMQMDDKLLTVSMKETVE
jgi:hypothetical protein